MKVMAGTIAMESFALGSPTSWSNNYDFEDREISGRGTEERFWQGRLRLQTEVILALILIQKYSFKQAG